MLLARRLSQQGPAGKMFLWREGGWRKTPLGWLVTALHSSPSLHCTVKVCHPLCHCALLVSPSQYQELLSANVLLSHSPKCASCWAWGPCHLSTLVWEELYGTVLACGAGAGCPLPTTCPQHLHASGEQALLLLLLHPSVTVICSSDPLKPHC